MSRKIAPWNADSELAKSLLVYLTEGDDKFQVSRNAFRDYEVHALGGNDRVTTGYGNDVIYGDAGNDTLDGADGNDSLYGGTGNDTLLSLSGNDSLYGGEGNDFYDVQIQTEARLEIRDDAGSDFIVAQITGEHGGIFIDAGQGNDLIAVNNTLTFPQVLSGNGYASIFSGEGNDTIYASDLAHAYIDTGSGDDRITLDSELGLAYATVIAGAGNDYIRTEGNINGEGFEGGDGNDFFSFGGHSIVNYVRGGNGDDSVYSDAIPDGFGARQVYGEAGNDSLFLYGRFSNSIDGGDGNDILFGDRGEDRLSGGAGNDVFIFNPTQFPNSGVPLIACRATVDDFQDGIDRLQFASQTFQSLNFSVANNGITIAFHDAAGDAHTVLLGGFTNLSLLTADDFIFI